MFKDQLARDATRRVPQGGRGGDLRSGLRGCSHADQATGSLSLLSAARSPLALQPDHVLCDIIVRVEVKPEVGHAVLHEDMRPDLSTPRFARHEGRDLDDRFEVHALTRSKSERASLSIRIARHADHIELVQRIRLQPRDGDIVDGACGTGAAIVVVVQAFFRAFRSRRSRCDDARFRRFQLPHPGLFSSLLKTKDQPPIDPWVSLA